MSREYRAIVDAGFILQLDCPDLAMSYALYPGIGLADYRKIISLNVEALNASIKDLPADRMRIHVCWGSTLGPHHGDIPLKDIVDIVLKAKPQAVVVPRPPIRVTVTSGRSGRTSSCRTARSSFPA